MHTKSVQIGSTVYHSHFSAIVDTLLSSQISFFFSCISSCSRKMYCNINLTVQLLKPGHSGEDFLSRLTTFFENKRFSSFFCKWTNKIQGSTIQPLKTLKLFELT